MVDAHAGNVRVQTSDNYVQKIATNDLLLCFEMTREASDEVVLDLELASDDQFPKRVGESAGAWYGRRCVEIGGSIVNMSTGNSTTIIDCVMDPMKPKGQQEPIPRGPARRRRPCRRKPNSFRTQARPAGSGARGDSARRDGPRPRCASARSGYGAIASRPRLQRGSSADRLR